MDVLTLSVPRILKLYESRKLSPVEVVEAVLSRTQTSNPVVNAFVLIDDDESLRRQARESERRWMEGRPLGPLDGIVVTSKDGADLIGWPTRDGSLTTSDKPTDADAPPEARLREAGAIFLGKTTTPEFGHKGVTDSPVSGITRNPWNPEKTSGGSSGGAAAAAAARMGFLHLGTDGGGSIRIPASFCGVFGFKPSGGLVPRYPPNPFTSLVATGPMARTVEDAAVMLDVISRPDPRDGNSVPYQKRDFYANLSCVPETLKIAYAPTLNRTPIMPEVAGFVADAAKKLEALGQVEEVDLDIPELVETFNTHWMVVASWLVNHTPEGERGKMDPHLLEWAERGSRVALTHYVDAELQRLRIIDQLQAFFNRYDILVMPTMAMTAFDAELNHAHDLHGKPWTDWTPLTFPANLARLPASSVPCGVTRDGLPVGLQIMSGYLKDSLVLNVSHALEQRLGFKDWLVRNKNEDRPFMDAA